MASSSEDITIDPAPTEINPYETLSLTPSATPEEIKSAYRKAALKHHPDKATSGADKATAHTTFQNIAFAYAVLSDPRRRARYDATGRTEESLHDDEDEEFDWASFYREQYADVVTSEAIEKFSRAYKGSEEERGDLLRSFTRRKGDLRKVYQEVMLSDVLVDEERFRGILDAAIANGEVEGFDKYVNESEKSRKGRVTSARKEKEREAKEAEDALAEVEEKKENGKSAGKAKSKKKEKAGDDLGGLAALIQQRQQGRAGQAESFFDKLEAKYAPKGKKGSKRAADDEPPEEAFAKNRAHKNNFKGKGQKLGEDEDGVEDAAAGSSRSKRSKK